MDVPRTSKATSTSSCETCAERGRPNEPVYKMGMCEFCFKGLRHPKATREQLAKETGRERTRISISAPQKRRLGQEDSSVRDRVNYPNPAGEIRFRNDGTSLALRQFPPMLPTS